MQRGNIIRHNRFHHVRMVDEIHLGNPVVQGVYLDDGMSGWRICEYSVASTLSPGLSVCSSFFEMDRCADNNSFIDLQNGFLFNGGHNNFVFDNYFQDVDYVAYLGGECKDNATYQNLVEASKWPAWAKYKDQKPQMTVPKSFGDFYKQTCPGGTFNQFKRNRYCRVAQSFFKAEPAAINTSVMEDLSLIHI